MIFRYRSHTDERGVVAMAFALMFSVLLLPIFGISGLGSATCQKDADQHLPGKGALLGVACSDVSHKDLEKQVQSFFDKRGYLKASAVEVIGVDGETGDEVTIQGIAGLASTSYRKVGSGISRGPDHSIDYGGNKARGQETPWVE